MAAKPNLKLVAPATENCAVAPHRPKNADLRTREHLTEREVDMLIETAKRNRYGHRDALMILMAYRHGLRAAEVVESPRRKARTRIASIWSAMTSSINCHSGSGKA